MTKQVYWLSKVGSVDDFEDMVTDTIIDGATRYGPWALMTPASHAIHGKGLGLGKGQKYVRQADGRWLKVEG